MAPTLLQSQPSEGNSALKVALAKDTLNIFMQISQILFLKVQFIKQWALLQVIA